MKSFINDSINYIGWELGIQFEIAIYTDGDELHFDKSFLFDIKRINICKSYSELDCKHLIIDTGLKT